MGVKWLTLIYYQLSGSVSRGLGSSSLSLKSWLAFGSCNSQIQGGTKGRKLPHLSVKC